MASIQTRILYLDHTAALGGGEIALLHLVRSLDTSRFHPIVALSSSGKLQERMAEANIETYILPLNSAIIHTRKDSLSGHGLLRPMAFLQVASYSIRLAKFIKQHRIDLVHTNSLKSDIFGGVAARFAGVPVIWHVRDRIADDYLPKATAHCFRWLCRVLPDFVIVNSHSTLQTLDLPAKKPVAIVYSSKHRYHVVHDGIVTNPKNQSIPNAPNKLSKPIVGLVGRISPWKGQHIFLEAAHKALLQFPEAKFQIIGSAMFGEKEYESSLHARTTELGLEKNVEFLGFREDVSECIESLDILVHASTVPEPFGQVVIEGMAAGKPVIATRGGGVLEIINHNVNGLLVEMGSVSEMSDAICLILSDPQSADRLGRAGRETVLKQFTIEHTASSVQTIYENLLKIKQAKVARR